MASNQIFEYSHNAILNYVYVNTAISYIEFAKRLLDLASIKKIINVPISIHMYIQDWKPSGLDVSGEWLLGTAYIYNTTFLQGACCAVCTFQGSQQTLPVYKCSLWYQNNSDLSDLDLWWA